MIFVCHSEHNGGKEVFHSIKIAMVCCFCFDTGLKEVFLECLIGVLPHIIYFLKCFQSAKDK